MAKRRAPTLRAVFEGDLRALARVQMAAADVSAPLEAPDDADAGSFEDELELYEAYQDALAQLKAHPALFSGHPNHEFTYEHPLLAVAAAASRAALADGPVLQHAGGEDLRQRTVHRWVWAFLVAWWNRRDQAYVDLAGRTPKTSVRLAGNPVRLAVVGDAGYAGLAQDCVLNSMWQRHLEAPFHMVVHLGDTYFAGSAAEFNVHFLDGFSRFFSKANVPVATLCGNHDLYYGTSGFQSALKILKQPGRYFLIETDHWRIACLDTALGSERMLRNSGRLDPPQLEWLEDLLDARDDRPLLLMSHHFITSAWDADPSPELAAQLRNRITGRVFAWYWGHEHGCAAYRRIKPYGYYGALVGNGAFRERFSEPTLKRSVQWHATGRCSCYGSGGPRYWQHGYLELELHPDTIVETYRLEGSAAPYTRKLRRSRA